MRGKTVSVLRVSLAVLFLYAGGIKLVDPAGFAGDIDSYRILPERLIVYAAYYLPMLEFLCGLCLLRRAWCGGASVVLMTLMIVFIAGLTAAWVRGLDIRCGCFGGDEESSRAIHYAWLIARDLVLLGCLGLVLKNRLQIATLPGVEQA